MHLLHVCICTYIHAHAASGLVLYILVLYALVLYVVLYVLVSCVFIRARQLAAFLKFKMYAQSDARAHTHTCTHAYVYTHIHACICIRGRDSNVLHFWKLRQSTRLLCILSPQLV